MARLQSQPFVQFIIDVLKGLIGSVLILLIFNYSDALRRRVEAIPKRYKITIVVLFLGIVIGVVGAISAVSPSLIPREEIISVLSIAGPGAIGIWAAVTLYKIRRRTDELVDHNHPNPQAVPDGGHNEQNEDQTAGAMLGAMVGAGAGTVFGPGGVVAGSMIGGTLGAALAAENRQDEYDVGRHSQDRDRV